MSPWDFINSINSEKKTNLIEEADNPRLAEKDYQPFITNRSFSYFPETIWLVNFLNKYHGLDKKIQYEFLLASVRPRKRWSPFKKKTFSEELELVKKYYNLSNAKAEAALSLLTQEQIEELRTIMDVGGI